LASHLRLCCAVASLSVAGCGELPTPPSSGPVFSVQSLLIAGASTQTVWVERLTPPDSSYTTRVRAVPPEFVHLTLVGDDGAATGFNPVPAQPGRFVAGVQVAAGAHYRLTGTVENVSIAAEATVPGPLDIVEPTEDTIRLESDSCLVGCSIRLRWSADGASALSYTQTPPDSLAGAFDIAGSASEPTTELRLLSRRGPTAQVTLTALDPAATAFLLGGQPQGNVSGAFGFLGAASYRTLWVQWQ
jgi:hypothetical protein